MIVERIVDGDVIRYSVCSDAKDNGGKVREIAVFDDFETAVIVMKYMRGDRMQERDKQYAKEAIRRV